MLNKTLRLIIDSNLMPFPPAALKQRQSLTSEIRRKLGSMGADLYRQSEVAMWL